MKRQARRINIATLIISGLFVSFAGITGQRMMACDCAWAGSPREELKRKDVVFSGEVIGVNREGGKIEFKVEKFWKGPRANKVSIEYEQSDCTLI